MGLANRWTSGKFSVASSPAIDAALVTCRYFKLRNSASGPEVGLSAGFRPDFSGESIKIGPSGRCRVHRPGQACCGGIREQMLRGSPPGGSIRAPVLRDPSLIISDILALNYWQLSSHFAFEFLWSLPENCYEMDLELVSGSPGLILGAFCTIFLA